MRQHTWTEVARHNTRSDCWIVLHGKVLDVTQWLEEHPGGADIILDNAGTDSTKIFHNHMGGDHTEAAQKLTEKYVIGTVSGSGGKAASMEDNLKAYASDEALRRGAQRLGGQDGRGGLSNFQVAAKL
eukprot:TRINITY_DN55402_c0_g1_i1.p2 TRINITY_DN55402_c0_g1~~TRINITY_DN55402_c0_g1_i1.p2  ORF type:complete len:128 (+),score=37.60 TRINITY_DN55402_c0_g1_i1:81-464(+)